MDLCHVSKQIKIRAENPLLGQDLKLQADVWSLKPTLKFMIWFDLIWVMIGQTNRHTDKQRLQLYIYRYKPGNPALTRLLKVTPAVYPWTLTILPGNKIFAIKVDPLNLESRNQAKNIPLAFPSSPIKIWGKSFQGFLSYYRTNKQTNKQTNSDYNFI